MSAKTKVLRIVLATLLACVSVSAQSTSGAVRGEVLDQSDAKIAGAAVELVNTATGLAYQQVTGEHGEFQFNLVPPGTYSIRASSAGFQTVTTSGLLVEVNRTLQVPLRLAIGATTETVNVVAESATVDTSSARVSTNVAEKYVVELPSSTRNALSFAEMAPGVQLIRTGSQIISNEGNYATVNGLRRGANVFYMDGTDNTGSFRNSALQFPNPEAVQEVQVSTANTSAEFGKQPGGVFNVITKSGTNKFRGSGFYFMRNAAFNANTWARNASGTARPADNVKQGGGTFGGPIRKNQTFFFTSFMIYRDKTADFQNTRQFATPAMVRGDFSQFPRQLYHPDTGQPLAGNQIPASLLDPVAQKLVARMPTVNNLGERFVWSYVNPIRNAEVLGKIDHNFGSAHQLQLTYFTTTGGQEQPATAGLGNVPSWGPQIDTSRQHTSAVRHSWVVTPRLLVQSRFALAHHEITRDNANIGQSLAEFGSLWPPVRNNVKLYLPNVVVSDGFAARQGAAGDRFSQQNYRIVSSASWTLGTHTLKFGGEFQRDSINNYKEADAAEIQFDGRSSSRPAGAVSGGIGVFGYSMADFLMGRSSSISVQGVRDYLLTTLSYYAFLEDEWRMNRRLTLTSGLRYEVYSPPREQQDRLSTFIPGHRSDLYPNSPPGLAFVGDRGIAEVYRWDRNNFGPRLGLAFDPTGTARTAIRAGFGVYFGYLAAQPKMLAGEQAPWQTTATGGETLNLTDPWGTSRTVRYTAPPTPFSTDPARFNYPARVQGRGFNPDFATPYTLQWNVSVQHQLRPGINVQAGYVANRGIKLFQNIEGNLPLWTPDASLTNLHNRRPFANYTTIGVMATRSRSWYDSLQLSGDWRLGGLLSRVTYVFGKSIALNDEDIGQPGGGGANPLDLDLDKAENGQRHVFRYFYVYDIPLFKDRNTWLSRVAGGWQVSGSIFAATGFPLDVQLGEDWNFDGVSRDRPNQIAPIRYTSGSRQDRMRRYFDLSSFGVPATRNTFGNLGRNALKGPGTWNIDAAILKNFVIREGFRAQLRGEAYNLANHPNMTAPVTNMRSVDFGRVLLLDGNRTMQMGLRLIF
jgi:hypothetical protein